MIHSRIMALDVGDVRIGVALSDPLRIFAQPLTTLMRRKDQDVISDIVKLMTEHHVSTLIVGMPNDLSGEAGAQAQKVRSFSEKLEKKIQTKLPAAAKIVFWDERLSTVQAERIIAGSKLKDRDRHAALDRISAAIILESYLAWLEPQCP